MGVRLFTVAYRIGASRAPCGSTTYSSTSSHGHTTGCLDTLRTLSEKRLVILICLGDLFEVVFQCGIDYVSERLWGQKSDAGTFNNKAVTSARVRIPNGYPCQRPITIVSWGKPTLNWNPHHEKDDDGNLLKPIVVDPNKWMPISDELKQRADHPRFAGCREATKRAKSHRPIEVEPLQKLLLGPHCTLTKTAKLSKLHDKANSTGMLDAMPGKKVKKRAHCIFTSAAGFVRYAG
eukprot:CAMPEP_0169162140 /NCGR_PEP_ID=MMETSP1015-20121227/57477_1 /TAXON_ID=342587 /ORGANISM="Karlodinium micrum, Strain CCMP2283" /LENGTH=234 /DNA_ID=CAMNT_0009234159 /DNA_START=440 /DNA_END=1144 /DNA_ORIENTATION=-